MRQKLAIICIWFILISMAPVGSYFPDVQAATPDNIIYVDPGKDVIQQAVDKAKDGDTIILRAGMYNGPYRGYYQEMDYMKDIFKFSQDVNINKSLTIRGDGSVTVIDNPFAVSSTKNVVIQNITFQSSYTNHGGGVDIWKSSNVRVEGCSFKENEAKYGAGVHIKESHGIIIANCSFEENDAYFISNSTTNSSDGSYNYTYSGTGGGGYVTGSSKIVFVNCNFTENIAYNSGGALSFEEVGADCVVTGCTFNGNWTDKNGGAVHTYKTEGLAVKNSKFSGNQSLPWFDDGSTGLKGWGGAVYSRDSKLELYECALKDSKSYYGGAIYGVGGSITVDRCGFFNNSVEYVKKSNITTIVEILLTVGGLDISEMISLGLEMGMTKAACPQNVVFPWDGWESFGGQGGAIYAANTELLVKNSEMTGNTSVKEGGALCLVLGKDQAQTKYRILDTAFIQNKSQKGGAVASLAKGAVYDNCNFLENEAEAVGGGLYSVENTTVSNSRFTRNKAPVGGGICSSIIGKTASINNCIFEENAAADKKGNGSGGAVYFFGDEKDADKKAVQRNNCRLHLSGSTFQKNAAYNGGAASLVRLTAITNSNSFRENGVFERGGALYTENSVVSMDTAEFNKNRAPSGGGAVFNKSSTMYLDRAKFLDNTSDYSGGAIFHQQGVFRGSNSLFTGNTAKGSGSVVSLERTVPAKLVNCTIASNGVNPFAARSYTFLELYNNIIVGNSQKGIVSDYDIYSDKNSPVTAKYNICGREGTGNIPGTTEIFRKPSEGDYRIRYDLPQGFVGPLDSGSNVNCVGNKDLAGNIRIVDNSGNGQANADMGAYEQDMLKVTFGSAHPLAGVAYGSFSGKTEQMVLLGHAADPSLVTVTPVSGWEFAGWEKLDRTKVTDLSRITGNLKLYAMYREKHVAVKYKFDIDKLKIADSTKIKIYTSKDAMPQEDLFNSGVLETLDAYTRQLTTYVKQYHTPLRPEMEGINGWTFSTWNPWPPSSAAADTTIEAVVRPTVTYDFRDRGSYGKDRQKVVASDYVNPLFIPQDKEIRVDYGYMLLGWSDKKDGKIITLPQSITEPATYYAIYGNVQPAIVIDNVIKAQPPYLPTDILSVPAEEGNLYTIKGRIEDRCGISWKATVDFGDPIGPYDLKINPDRTFLVQHRFYDDKPRQYVVIKVRNNYGYTAAAIAQVLVKNAAPVVDAGEDGLFYRGTLFKRPIEIIDPGRDTWTATVDYGDGTTRQLQLTTRRFELAKVYEKANTYQVRVSVFDQDGGKGNASFWLKIKDFLLELLVGSDTVVNEGQSFEREISVSGPGEKIKEAEVDFGDGTPLIQVVPVGRSFFVKHVFPDDGLYKVKIKITDVEGDIYIDSFNVKVLNVVPVVNVGNGGDIRLSDRFTSSGLISDPGTDNWKAEVDYGDGSGWQTLTLDEKKFFLSHSYSLIGDYTITVKVTDDDGGVGIGTLRIAVRGGGADLSDFNATMRNFGGSLLLSITNTVDTNGNLFNGSYRVSVVCPELVVNLSDPRGFVKGAIEEFAVCPTPGAGAYTFTIRVAGVTNPKVISINI